MTRSTISQVETMQSRIDKLVGGELVEDERRELLNWLESDTSRWRACGLAFLEAQLWEQALEEGTASAIQDPAEYAPMRAPSAEQGRGSWRPWWGTLAVLAASIAAFFCGAVARDWAHRPQSPVRPIVDAPGPQAESPQDKFFIASVPVNGGPLGDVAATLQIPVRPVEAAASDGISSVPQHVRKQWERRGYELVEERRYLPAKLPDGRQVMVPVNEVKMKFVGRPVS